MTTSEVLTSSGQTVEKKREPASGAPPIPPEAAPREQAAERTLGESLRYLIESVRPESIFGAPVEREGVVIIPCAEVRTGFGMGGGSGFGPASTPARGQASSATTPADEPSGGGGIGGGGGAQGRPVAVIAVSNGQARVLPIIDVTRLMLVGLTTVGLITLGLSQSLSRSRPGSRAAPSTTRFARALRAASRRGL